jgi:redox-sensing transcriptional repressor
VNKEHTVSNSVIRRLPRYYRFLGELLNKSVGRISSKELSEIMGITASQIRQDLNCFGGFGQQGYGYNTKALYDEIGKILGVNNVCEIIMIGAGNLGRAIAHGMNFEKRGFKLTRLFDVDKSIVGKEVNSIPVSHMDELEVFCKSNSPKAAILCIPKDQASTVCDKLISLGIKGIWNFSHYDLSIRKGEVVVENVHLGDSLMTFSYNVKNQ